MSAAFPAARDEKASDTFAARGRLLLTGHPDGRVTLTPDAMLVWTSTGALLHAGPATAEFAEARLVAGSPRAMLLAGFWDPHVHLPQLELAGRYREPLLTWLERRVFPEEARHRDPAVARGAAESFFEALLAAGTLGAGIFAAPSETSAVCALEEAWRRGVPCRCGPSLMDTGAPADLLAPVERWEEIQQRLFRRFARDAAVVPRFVLAASPALLTRCGELARSHRAFVLGHIAETKDEVAAVVASTGEPSYTEVYERAGLLGPRTVLAHGIHLDDTELGLLAFSRTVIAHCPASNRALGSGRMPLERLRARGVRWCLASDVGAAPELSLLHVIDTFLEVHRGHVRVDEQEAYWRATFAGADALGYGAERGALVPGRQADFLVVAEAPPRVRTPRGAIRALLRRGREDGWSGLFEAAYVSGHRVR
ncbi:MAG: guanine deaminase [Acidobacteriota bacterium]